MNFNNLRVLYFLIPLYLLFEHASASEVAMSFSGVLNEPPPCTINNGEKIDIDFGDKVGVGKVDGKNYLQNINYQIVCEDNSDGNILGLTVVAAPSGFDDSAVPTDDPDLAIRLLLSGTPFLLNKRVAIDIDNLPILQAVPVKRQGANLKPKSFSAQATLLANYQ